MKFEYCTIYYRDTFDNGNRVIWGEFSLFPPDPNSQLAKERSGFSDPLNKLGADGWELVSSTLISTTKDAVKLYLIFKKIVSNIQEGVRRDYYHG